jgi:hypothetical protein
MSCISENQISKRFKRGELTSLDRVSAGVEVALLVAFIMMLAWVVPKLHPSLKLYCALALLTWTFGLTIMSHISHGESLEDLGFGRAHIGRAFAELIAPVGILAVILLMLGLALDTLHFNRKFFFQLLGIPFWGIFQQYAAQSFINRRLQLVFGPGWKSIGMTAFIFAAIHLPNPALTVATAIAGLCWARAFQRAPNLYAIALSHGLLSALFANSMPKWILNNMTVGYNYLLRLN